MPGQIQHQTALADTLPQQVYTVTVGERGQVVIPAELRHTCHFHPRDTVLVFRYPGCSAIVLVRLADLPAFLHELNTLGYRSGCDELRR